jgi:hypothetical protein
MKRHLVSASLALAVLVACGSTGTAGPPGEPVPGVTSNPAVESATPSPSEPGVTAPVSPPPSVPTPVPQGTLPAPTSTQTVRVERSPEPPPKVTGVRFARHAGFDRVVLDFDGSMTGYTASWVNRLVQDGSGAVIDVEGGAFLRLVLNPAYAHDDDGEPTWAGPRQVTAGLPNVNKIVRVGDFEGYVSVGLVLDRKAGFRVLEQTSPTRLVIDVAH